MTTEGTQEGRTLKGGTAGSMLTSSGSEGHSSYQGCVTLAGCSHQSPASVRPRCGSAAPPGGVCPGRTRPTVPTLGASGPGCGTSCNSPGRPPTPRVSLSPKQQRASFSQGAVHTSEVMPRRVSQLQRVAAQWEGGWRLLGRQDSPWAKSPKTPPE